MCNMCVNIVLHQIFRYIWWRLGHVGSYMGLKGTYPQTITMDYISVLVYLLKLEYFLFSL